MLPPPVITGLDLGLASDSHHPDSLNPSSQATAREIGIESWHEACYTDLMNYGILCGQYIEEKENAHALGKVDSAIWQRG